MRRSRRLATAAVGLVAVVVATPVARWMTSTPTGHTWSEVIDESMSDLPGIWRALRGLYAYALIPALLALLAVLVFITYRHRDSRAAWVFVVVVVLSNVTVQFVKLAPLGIEESPSSLDPLSGHVGVAAGVCLGWMVVAPTWWRVRSAAAAAATLVTVTSGVMLAGWHSPFQVLCPLLIATGWTCVGVAVMSSEVESQGRGPDRERYSEIWHGRTALLSGLLVVAGTTALLFGFLETFLQVGFAAVVLAAFWAAGWCSAAVGVVLLVSRDVSESAAGQPGAVIQTGR